jgi:hypothetical protein
MKNAVQWTSPLVVKVKGAVFHVVLANQFTFLGGPSHYCEFHYGLILDLCFHSL